MLIQFKVSITFFKIILVSISFHLTWFDFWCVIIGATYCICKDGAQDPTAYQKVIDYARGAGADCKAIQDNGPCFVQDNPKAICDYAVNSYFQNKGQTPEACQFSGAATPSNNLPSSMTPLTIDRCEFLFFF